MKITPLSEEAVSTLKEIKEQLLHTPEGELLLFKIPKFTSDKASKSKASLNQANAIYDLRDVGAFSIVEQYRLENEQHFYLKVVKSKIADLYSHYIENYSDSTDKIQITIHAQKGIYVTADPMRVYGIKGKKRLKYVVELKRNKNIVYLEDIRAITGQSNKVIKRGIKEINRLFKKDCALKYDLILPASRGGYSLNRERYSCR